MIRYSSTYILHNCGNIKMNIPADIKESNADIMIIKIIEIVIFALSVIIVVGVLICHNFRKYVIIVMIVTVLIVFVIVGIVINLIFVNKIIAIIVLAVTDNED